MYWRTTGRWHWRAACATRIARGRWSRGSVMLRKRPSKASPSKVWSKLRPTWITGRKAGRTRGFTALPNGKWRPCWAKRSPLYSAPPGWIGRQVQVQWDLWQVRLLHPQTGERLREHLRQERGKHRIQDADRPKHTPRGTPQL